MPFYESSIEVILSTHKRARGLAHAGPQDKGHELFILWSNLKMFLDGMISRKEYDGYLDLLGYFGEKVDHFSKTHMLRDDQTLRSMLYEWLQYSNRFADFSDWQKEEEPKPNEPLYTKVNDGLLLHKVTIKSFDASARVSFACGFLWEHDWARVGVDRGWASGEYGEKMSGKEIKAWLQELLVDRARKMANEPR